MMSKDILILQKLIQDLRVDLKSDLKEQINQLESKISTNIQELNEKLTTNFSNIQRQIENVNEDIRKQDKRILFLEKQIRARNVIFFGVEESEKSYEELVKNMIHIITNVLKVECNRSDLEIIRRMGKKSEEKKRPVNITFVTFGMKLNVLRNNRLLKNTDIYLKEDYPTQILETRKSLQDQLQKARQEGNYAFIRYDKLIIREPQPHSSCIAQKNNNQNSKKRELEITPPNQSEGKQTLHVRNHQQIVKRNKTKSQKSNNILTYIKSNRDRTHSRSRSPSASSTDEKAENKN